MLVEDFVYSGTLSIINPYSPIYHVVESDSGGMIPQSLKAVLSQWGSGEEAEPDRPKVISIKEYFFLFQAIYPSALRGTTRHAPTMLIGSLHQSNGSQSYGNISLR